MIGSAESEVTRRGFRISWSIDEAEWERARETSRVESAGGEYDRRHIAINRILWGQIQYANDGQVLFPPARLRSIDEKGRDSLMKQGDHWYDIPDESEILGITCSILDVAYKLEWVFRARNFLHAPVGASVYYPEEESSRRVYFEKTEQAIVISSNQFMDIELIVPTEMFFVEIDRFLTDFVRAVRDNVALLLTWETFAGLRRFLR